MDCGLHRTHSVPYVRHSPMVHRQSRLHLIMTNKDLSVFSKFVIMNNIDNIAQVMDIDSR